MESYRDWRESLVEREGQAHNLGVATPMPLHWSKVPEHIRRAIPREWTPRLDYYFTH
jgi:hypothetical protein